MTSKEALEKIIFDYNFKEKIESGYVYHSEVPFMEAIVIIMEDLEVLDILKENIVECVGDSAGNEYLKLLLHKFGNEEKYHKVKEWLENDK